MDKYTENRLRGEIILYLKYLNVSRVTYCNPYKERKRAKLSYTSMYCMIFGGTQGKSLDHVNTSILFQTQAVQTRVF